MEILKIKSGTVSYRTEGKKIRALDELSISINAGSSTAIIGESGAGKTTLLRVLGDLTKLERGKSEFLGNNIKSLGKKEYFEYRKNVQYIFQDPYDAINPKQSIKGFLLVPVRYLLKIRSEKQGLILAQKTLEEVGLTPEIVFRYPHELSGGQRQRVVIARALLSEPSVLLADEPTSMLDASASAGILNIFKRLKQEKNITIVIVTHNISIAAYLADTIYVMYNGRIVEFAKKEDLVNHQFHPYTKLLVDTSKSESLLEIRDQTREENVNGCPYYNYCSYRTGVCKTNNPELLGVSENHWVACHNKLI